jgi:hypothetical protein
VKVRLPRSVEGRLSLALLVLVVVSVSGQVASLQDEAGLIDAAQQGPAKSRNRALFRLEARGTENPAIAELVRSALADDDPDVACYAWMRHRFDGRYAADAALAVASRDPAEQLRWRLIALRTKTLEELEACLDGFRDPSAGTAPEK